VGDRAGLEWRPIEPADAKRWSVLLAGIQAVDRDWSAYFTEDDLLEDFSDPDHDFPQGSVAVLDGDAMVGYGVLMARSDADPVHEMRFDGGVHPTHRHAGIGRRLLDWAETAAVPMHEARHAGRPLTLNGGCDSQNAAAATLYAARGYRPVRWFHAMVKDLSDPLPDVAVPAGVELVGLTLDRSQIARQVRNEAFRDHWGSTETSAEAWQHFMESGVFRPAFSFLAYEADQPIGVIISHEYDAYLAATGVHDLHIAVVATVRAGRKRGIASALMARALTDARAAGYTAASLGVDADSLTGAVGLYERAGFTVEYTSTVYEKTLA
jgi:mycothiol synthase